MNKIKGGMTITLTAEEVVGINELIERDMPMPMGRYYWQTEKFKNDPPQDTCGVCGRMLAGDMNFCPVCGRRIDRENYLL